MLTTPTFAVVGAVNHGKSSTVAALLEDDAVRISPMPGETVANQRFDLRDLLVLYDTPGFQNARKALLAIGDARAHEDPLQPFRRFVDAHRDDPAFDAECRLLQPIVDGAGVVYVVDGSKPLRDLHLAEMEILRRTGAPRLAIVNRTGTDDHVDAWTGRLAQHFNLVRVFDAHHATHADRRDLIESLASIERRWKDPLQQALRLIEAEHDRRIADAAAEIADLVAACLRHVERAPLDADAGPSARDALAAKLKARYTAAIATKERDAHRRLIALYAHRRVSPEAMPDDVFGSALFGDETWHLFGLDARQLLGASTVAGGVAGAGIDAATLGHSFGLGAAIGAAAGAGGAWLLGKRRPDVSIARPTGALPRVARALLPGGGLRFGGRDVVVGPFAAANFPWIVVDRALCLFAFVYTRSHARRDVVVADIAVLAPVLERLGLTVAQWPDATRDACTKAFGAIRRGDDSRSDALRVAIDDALRRIAGAERAIDAALAAGR